MFDKYLKQASNKNLRSKSPIKRNNKITNDHENNDSSQKKLNIEYKKFQKDLLNTNNMGTDSNVNAILKSNEIFEEMKLRSINLIFSLLDFDGDNKISCGKMNIDSLLIQEFQMKYLRYFQIYF